MGGADGGSRGPRDCSVGASIPARLPAPAQAPRLGWTPGPSSPIPLVAAGATHLPVLRPHVVPQGCPSALLTYLPQPPASRPPRVGAPSTAFSPQSPGSPSAQAPAGSGAAWPNLGGSPPCQAHLLGVWYPPTRWMRGWEQTEGRAQAGGQLQGRDPKLTHSHGGDPRPALHLGRPIPYVAGPESLAPHSASRGHMAQDHGTDGCPPDPS